MKIVPLHGAKAAGRVALVDDEDYDLVMQYRWHVREYVKKPGHRPDGPYALVNVWQRSDKCITILMHKLITGWARIDHADHDGLNNQRYNLRPASTSQNLCNQRPQIRETSSRYKGVAWERRNPKHWRAYITHEGHRGYLGNFLTETEAAHAYDAAARELFGEFAYTNFPDAA